MKAKTAISRAIRQRFDVKKVRFMNGQVLGYVEWPGAGSWSNFGPISEFTLKDTGLGSTAVWHKGNHVATIWGKVTDEQG